MANRSKKVVLSARVDPYLKAALELFAASCNEKIVKILQTCVENGLSDQTVSNPIKRREKDKDEMSFMVAFTAIWSENEILYKLRAGSLGQDFAGEELATIAMFINGDTYFDGDFDVFGDMNGYSEAYGLKPYVQLMVNLPLVEDEWPIVEEYVKFLSNNKPFQPTYSDYKKMRSKAG
jgi:hypothetical protein